jgi:hypothetical protein
MTNNIRWECEPKKKCWAEEDSHTCARGIILQNHTWELHLSATANDDDDDDNDDNDDNADTL